MSCLVRGRVATGQAASEPWPAFWDEPFAVSQFLVQTSGPADPKGRTLGRFRPQYLTSFH